MFGSFVRLWNAKTFIERHMRGIFKPTTGVRGCPLMTRFLNREFFFFGSLFLFASQQKEKVNVTKD